MELELRAPGTKRCSKCKVFKPLDAFFRRSNRRSGRESKCIECKAKIDANRWSKNRMRFKEHDLERRYNLSIDEYKAMLNAQNGVCAICKQPEKRVHQNGTPSSLCIDHCHTTDAIRGLLCDKCNRALALIHEDPEIAASLLKYIQDKCLW